MRIIRPEYAQGSGQVEQVVAITAAGSVAAVDMVGDIRVDCWAQPGRIVLGGEINQAFDMIP